jgi:Putative adhesin
MKTSRTLPFLMAAALALLPLSSRADEAQGRIAFSDPSKPGTLKIRVLRGEVTVHGEDVKDISVKSDAVAAEPTPRKDGMRVLSTTSGFRLTEEKNVAVLIYGEGDDGWTGGSADFEITVPRNTSIVVANAVHGDFKCTGVSGDVDVRSVSGDVELEDISGGALVETLHGDISVGMKALPVSRPLSFTSMGGEINIKVPSDSKADIRFHTHHGLILTNFDDKVLVTKTEISQTRIRREKHKSHDPESDKDKDGVAPVPPVASVPPVDSVKPDQVIVIQKDSDSDSSSDWHTDVRDSIREAAMDAADAAREAAQAVHEGLIEAHIEMGGGIPPLPPMTGGKVVSGTLNGGGVEIQAATLNGDIQLRKGD